MAVPELIFTKTNNLAPNKYICKLKKKKVL